ncbi:MAG: DNA internalization-related competence protein ComEC/Rec2 [Longimicrobiales bacterium]
MALPTLTTLTLWYAGGIAWAVLLRIAPLPALLCGLAVLVVLLGTRRRAAALRVTWSHSAAFGLTGALLACLALAQRERDCRRGLRDGATVQVSGALLEANSRSAWLALSQLQGRSCAGPVRLLMARARGNETLRAGQVISVRGEWWADLNASPIAPARGVLSVQSWQLSSGHDWLAQLRGQTAARIAQLFGEQAPLAAALLIAQRDEIDPKVKRDFGASGLAHLLAISGTHVALVAAVLALLAAVMRLPVVWSGALAALGSCAYVLFLGAPYPAVRAALQIVLVLVARVAQRPAHPLGLIAAAALAILVYDPLALLDAGFQLSFAGLLGIVLWRKPMIERMPVSLPLVLRDAVATSTAASLATTPIVAFHFGQVSFIAVPANLVALPLVSLAVPAAALALAVSAAWPGAASFLADGTRLLLIRLEDTAALAAAVPGGHIYVTRVTVSAWLGALVLGVIVWRSIWFLRPRFRWMATLGLASVLPIGWPFLPSRTPDSIDIHAIDVGQGDAFAIRSPRGRWLLVDAGPTSDRHDAGLARVVPFLLQRGASTLDLLVLTHPHLDHIGGARAVMQILETRIVLDADSGRGARAALGHDAPGKAPDSWLVGRAGTRITFDGLTIEVLHPTGRALDVGMDPNDYSIVFRLGFGQFSALFTGDAPASVEDALVRQYGARLDVDLLKVGHHGSRTATGDAWLRVSSPRFALISAGRGNRYGHPAPTIVHRLEAAGVQVFRTDRSGHISLRAFQDGRILVLDP